MLEFDKRGLLVKQKRFNGDIRALYIWEFSYNDEGQLMQEKSGYGIGDEILEVPYIQTYKNGAKKESELKTVKDVSENLESDNQVGFYVEVLKDALGRRIEEKEYRDCKLLRTYTYEYKQLSDNVTVELVLMNGDFYCKTITVEF